MGPGGGVDFTVYGTAQPAGSKRAFAVRAGGVPTGRVAVTDDNPKSKGWKQEVAEVGRDVMAGVGHEVGAPLWTGALGIAVTFFLQRPKGHYGTGRNAGVVKASAPAHPVVKPDTTKLLRGLEDALTGVVWKDDAAVVEQFVSKRYGDPPRVRVVVWNV